MDEQQEQKMTPFDQMISNDNLQLLKASIPYAPVKMQEILSVLVKIKELETVLSLTKKKPSVQMMSHEKPDFSFTDMISDIGRYTSGSMKEKFDGISQAISMIELLQDMDMSEMDMENMNFEDIFQGFNDKDKNKKEEENKKEEKPKNKKDQVSSPLNDSDVEKQEDEVDDIINSFIRSSTDENQ